MSKIADVANERDKKQVATILVSQPKPEDKNSQYYGLAEKHNLSIDFRSFIEVERIEKKEFRQQKIDILSHNSVIFTSRHSVDSYFLLCRDLRIEVPSTMMYFCISEQTANYLQKYITIRKRKMYTGTRTASDLIEVLKKHKEKKFLYPCSETPSEQLSKFLKDNEYQYTHALTYKTVACDLSDLTEVKYDVIAFFSPYGIKSLFTNFPNFKQNDTRIAGFGPLTCKTIREHGLIVDIEAPSPQAPSMTGALDLYIKESSN